MLRNVAIFYHPRREQAIVEAEWLGGELGRQGIDVTVADGWDEGAVDRLCCNRELLIVLGGDGTIIRISRLAAPHGVPLLGINLGRVGFLAEMTPERLHDCVDDLAAGRFWVEVRTMLDVHAVIGGQAQRFLCLNEVAVARGVAPRAIRVNTVLDGEEFMTYTADGVLVATATGSTAYTLAAGGSILYPESRDFIITPVAPHLHIGTSMVVRGDTIVRLSVSSDRSAVMSVDGAEEHPVHTSDWVEVCRSEMVARFARLGPRKYFYSAIADRLK